MRRPWPLRRRIVGRLAEPALRIVVGPGYRRGPRQCHPDGKGQAGVEGHCPGGRRAGDFELGDIIVARLGQLPPIARLPIESGHTLLVVHGSPADPTEPFDINMSDDELIALLGDEPGDLIGCGGSHVPFDRTVADVRIVNVGSVGEAPSGDHAAAAIITTSQLGISVEQLAVPLPAPN